MPQYKIGIIIFLIFSFSISSPAKAIKPRPPVQLSFSSSILSDEETRITLSAKAIVDSNKLSIEIKRPLGLQLIDGKETWEGPIKKGEVHKLEIIILNEGSTSYEISGEASLHFINGGTFKQKSQLILNPLTEERSIRLPPIRQKGNRDTILEFRGK